MSSRLQSRIVQLNADQLGYFSNWLYPVVHVLASLPSVRNAENIAARLQLPLERVRQVVADLLATGLLREDEGGLGVTEHNLSLPVDSPQAVGFHTSLRHLGLSKVQTRSPDEGITYSVVHAIREVDAVRVKSMLLDVVKQTRELAFHSPEEQAYLFLLDFHQIS